MTVSDETLTPDDDDDSDDQTPAVRAAIRRQRHARMRRTMFLELIQNTGITVLAHEQSTELTPGTDEPRLTITVWGDELSMVLTQMAHRETRANVSAQEWECLAGDWEIRARRALDGMRQANDSLLRWKRKTDELEAELTRWKRIALDQEGRQGPGAAPEGW